MNLKPFFAPKNMVIIGASRKLLTFNYTLVKNLRELRYNGKIYIIHPEADEILGIQPYRTFEELPEKPELAIILLTKEIEQIIFRLIDLGVKYYLIESDISNILEEGKIIDKLRELSKEKDLLIMGPGMIGIINTDNFFTTSIIPVRRHIIQNHRKYKNNGSGALSFYAQSGGLSGALGWWNPLQNIPISKIIHIGKSISVSESDILQFLFDDPDTSVISLFIKDPSQEFIDTLKKNAGKKPVLYKNVGKTREFVKELETFAIEVQNYIELFEFAKVFLWCPEPNGTSLGIIGPSSGAIHLLISEMRNTGLHIAKLDPDTKKNILTNVGGSTCVEGNPIDYWPPTKFIGTEVCKVYFKSSNFLLEDNKVDALFLALEFFSEIEFDFDVFDQVKKRFPQKPIIAILIQAEKEGRERIIDKATELRIPVFVDEAERAIRAYSALYKFYEYKRKKND